ncbi:MAG: ABC transporter substrate-binding protein [Candidatus Promineifilaceae bacterium]|nr:ABC transporter substrate-binding protein [Candidatus Promineifilaceae bacterium]
MRLRTNFRQPSIVCHSAMILILWLSLAGCQVNSGRWERIKESGTLRVGLDPTYPPFEIADESGISGLDVDLADALAAELGINAEFVYFGYDGLYDALATKQVDVLISALVIMPEKRRDFDYSEPYFNAGEILIVSNTEELIRNMADLANHRLAVELGALGHVEAIQWAKKVEDLQVVPFPGATEALDALSAGETDAALVDSISGRLYLKENPQLKRIPEPVTVEPYAIVVRIEDERLLVELNEALRRLKANGQLDKIVARWIGS